MNNMKHYNVRENVLLSNDIYIYFKKKFNLLHICNFVCLFFLFIYNEFQFSGIKFLEKTLLAHP